MAKSPLLDSARLKVERARHHRADFVLHGSKWCDEVSRTHKPPVRRRDEDLGDGLEAVVYEVDEAAILPPPILSLVLGDALTNFRAALDHTAWSLSADANGGSPPSPTQIQFPITASEDDFNNELRRRLPNVAKHAVEAIRRRQPYKNGAQAPNHPLHLLKELVNADKHRGVSVTILEALNMVADNPIASDNFEVHSITHASHKLDRLKPGTELLRITGR
jgi:hypothetical protein